MVLYVYVFAEGAVFDYAQNALQTRSVLKESNEFVYVDIPDDFVHLMIHYIEEDGFEEPPYFERGDDRISALKDAELVEAPFLDELRRKYGLSEKRYDYHITLGVKFKTFALCAG